MVSDEFYQQLLTTLAVVPTRDGHHHGINGKALLGFCACNDLVVTNTCFPHKSIHKFTWFQNGDCTRPGRIIDYVLENRHFRTSTLDACVFHSTQVQSDDELVVSTRSRKHLCKNTGLRKWQTCSLPLEMRIRFKAILAAALPSQPAEEQDVEKVWGVPKSALNEIQDTLPKLSQRLEKEWGH